MSERIVVVHNPNSTKSRDVKREVFGRLRDAGITFDAVESKTPDHDSNAEEFAEFFREGDTILGAGGDGAHTQIKDGMLLSGLPGLRIGFLGYGNFNDIAVGFNGPGHIDPLRFLDDRAQEIDAIPMHVDINGKTIRRPLAYATLGWTATASGKFADGEFRQLLKERNKHFVTALSGAALFREYFQRRKELFLPHYTLNDDREYNTRITDVVALNHPRMGRFIRRNDFDSSGKDFAYAQLDVSGLMKNSRFLTQAFIGNMPATLVNEQRLEFQVPSTIPYQNEGEFMLLEGVETLIFSKQHDDVIRVIRPY
jgi:diacylglycerol kinase family enzyme